MTNTTLAHTLDIVRSATDTELGRLAARRDQITARLEQIRDSGTPNDQFLQYLWFSAPSVRQELSRRTVRELGSGGDSSPDPCF